MQSEQRRQDGRIKEQLLPHICSYQSDAEKNLLQEIASRNPGGELDLLDTVVLPAFLSTATLMQSVRQSSHRIVSKYAVIPADLQWLCKSITITRLLFLKGSAQLGMISYKWKHHLWIFVVLNE